MNSNCTTQPIQDIVLASNNAGKITELTQLLAFLPVRILSQKSQNIIEVDETCDSFVGNALLKARHAAQCSGLAAIADDSGLVVDYLGGAPGVYSARYSEQQTDSANNLKLLQALDSVPLAQRSARFVCVLVFIRHAQDTQPLIAQASLEGLIAEQAMGEQGFGYDPLFWLPEFQQTLAQIPLSLKNKLSHRGKACQQLKQLLSREASLCQNSA